MAALRLNVQIGFTAFHTMSCINVFKKNSIFQKECKKVKATQSKRDGELMYLQRNQLMTTDWSISNHGARQSLCNDNRMQFYKMDRSLSIKKYFSRLFGRQNC